MPPLPGARPPSPAGHPARAARTAAAAVATAARVLVRPVPGATDRGRRSRGAALLALGVLALAAVANILRVGSRTTFFYDEWSWILDRRGWTASAFLTAHNGHLSIVPVLIYHLLFATVGLRAYLPYRLVLMAFHVAVALLLYLYCRRRLGPVPALLPPALMLFLGAAYQDLLWPFQVGFLASLAFGLAAFLLLDRPEGADAATSLRREIGVALCLVAAVSSSGLGLSALAGAAIRVLLGRNWRRWWVVGIPTVYYLTWYARYGVSAGGSTPRQVWAYFEQAFRAALGALSGQSGRQHPVVVTTVTLIFLAALLARLAWAVGNRRLPVDLLGALGWAGSFWILIAITRGGHGDFGASRYLYPGGVALLLVLAEILRNVALSRFAVAGLAVLTALSIRSGQDTLNHGGQGLTSVAARVRADLAALEHSRPAPSYRPNPRLMPVVTAGRYRRAAAALGSPALAWAALPAQSSGVRDDADRVLRQAGDLALLPTARRTGSGRPITLVAVDGIVEHLPDGCLDVLPKPGTDLDRLTVRQPPDGLLVGAGGAPVSVTARRFGPDPGPFATLAAGRHGLLTGLPDGSAVPWVIGLQSGSPILTCAGG
jgi:hypothetical protein